MRPLMEKIWVRALALILFCVFSLSAMVFFWVYSFALEDGWYSRDTDQFSFTDTGMCQSYIQECLRYVRDTIIWLDDPTSTTLNTYGGRAFSYTVSTTTTGEITADTRTEKSQPVSSVVFTMVENGRDREYRVEGYVNLPVEPFDGCYREYYIFQLLYPARSVYLPGTIISALLAAALLIFSIAAAVVVGKSGVSTLSGRIPFDVALVALAVVVSVASHYVITLLGDNIYRLLQGIGIYEIRFRQIFRLWYAAAIAVILANQLSAGTLRRRLLLRRVVGLMTPGVLTAVLCVLHFMLLMAGLVMYNSDLFVVWMLLMVVYDIALIPCLVRSVIEGNMVHKASNALAEGDLAYKVDAKRLHLIWRDLGQDLDRIGDGMTAAVEERMRSERMKTELITNVSHDLKTPLTSIINYIALLKDESLPPETRREYLEVLDRQSAKLKKLTEDVVEASKAASGVMTVSPEMLDVAELLEQSVGEYSERLKAAQIEPILHKPEGEAYILADGRLLGRVLDNFITNVIKYAQPGTRAYFDLTAGREETVIAVKNTSRAPLDIPADELMERFVRGDSSRSTEGSGLGLSIARSLTELMGGRLRLVLDGDLFKAEVAFPTAPPPAETKKALPDGEGG